MLGRKDYTQEELDAATANINSQLAAYRTLAKAVGASKDAKAAAALAAFEPLFFNNMTLVLDRLFVHRVRLVTGKDGNPVNEVELLADSLMNNAGVFRPGTVVKYIPEQAVTQLKEGDSIALTVEEFEKLAQTYLADIEAKFR